MLKIFFGEMENAIYTPSVYFNNQYEDEWLEEDLAKAMIEDVDQSKVVSSHLIESPVLGPIPPERLSGGVKTLLLMAFDDSGHVFNGSACGDNCAKWISTIGTHKDLTINLHHIMDFSTVEGFSAFIINTGKMTESYEAYLEEAIKIPLEDF